MSTENPEQQNKADPSGTGAAAPWLGVRGVPSNMKGAGSLGVQCTRSCLAEVPV